MKLKEHRRILIRRHDDVEPCSDKCPTGVGWVAESRGRYYPNGPRSAY